MSFTKRHLFFIFPFLPLSTPFQFSFIQRLFSIWFYNHCREIQHFSNIKLFHIDTISFRWIKQYTNCLTSIKFVQGYFRTRQWKSHFASKYHRTNWTQTDNVLQLLAQTCTNLLKVESDILGRCMFVFLRLKNKSLWAIHLKPSANNNCKSWRN